MRKELEEFDLETRRAALLPNAGLDDEIVRQVRAASMGESLYQYEKRLKDMGVDF